MSSARWIWLMGLALALTLAPAVGAKDDPLILAVRVDGSELVVEGTALAEDEATEPSVTLNDQVLVVTSFSTAEVRTELPNPPLGPGSYLLTVESSNGKVGVFDATLAVADLICVRCVSETELDFDPATQGELDTHAGSADAHLKHAALEESTEIDQDILAHADNASAHTPTTTKGDLLVEDGADVVRLPVGTDGQVLVADSRTSEGVTWMSVADPCPVCTAPALVPRTGQATSYGNRDDGELERGVAWPNPRFADNGDGTVTDNLTGLIWLKDASCFAGTVLHWPDVLAHANNLASGSCGLTDGSVAGDWRLPTVKELLSLVHWGVFSPVVPNTAGTGKWSEGDPFWDVRSADYWTSTSFSANPQHQAYKMNMDNGAVIPTAKLHDTGWPWPVRGGQ